MSSWSTDRPGPARLGQAVEWLMEHAHENLGTELVLRAVAEGAERRHVEVVGAAGIEGVSVWAPGGQWFLEAVSEEATLELAEGVRRGPASPAKVTTSGTVKDWLRPWLLSRRAASTVSREHDLFAMACMKSAVAGAGRWATPADREPLDAYQTAYNEERRTRIAPDWDALLARRAVAVLEEDGRIAAVVKRTGNTGRYATIGGTWTHPDHRKRGLATRLTAFVAAALLEERPAVHLVVDDDNVAAIALYRSVGFDEVGRCSMAYLRGATW